MVLIKKIEYAFIVLLMQIILLSRMNTMFFYCPRYDNIRRNYMFNWYTGPTEVIYFYNIMSSDNENTIRNTALIINKLLKIVNNT